MKGVATINLFEVAAKIKLKVDEYENALKKVEEKTQKTRDRIKKIGSAITGSIEFAAKASAAALGVAAAGVAALTKQSLDAYADYQQLVGGVEKLFGSAADKMVENAQNAFQTTQMSANQYMETATSIAAFLVNGVAKSSSKAASVSVEEIEKMANDKYNALVKSYDSQYKSAQKSYDRQYKALEKSLDAEISAFEKATEAKINQINLEYKERLKLIDEEKYNQLKAIDDQINALNAQTEAEQAEIERREQEEKKVELSNKVLTAKTAKERAAAQKELADYVAKIKQKEVEDSRRKEIEKLRDQKETIKDQADARKEALQEQQNAEVEQIREASKAQVAIMRESKQEQLDALKEINEAKLESLKEYYDKQKELAKLAAEAEVKAAEERSGEVATLTSEQYNLAADIADMAMRDMADNANVFDKDIADIQAAYMSLARGQYQMLDNLQLGYGGSKTELERLLVDAERLSGIHYEIDNFADVVQAIHVIQESMNIAGTAAEESKRTISGSVNALKAAWANLMIGLADNNADLSKKIDDVVVQAGYAFDAILPVAEKALGGIADLIQRLAPIIAQKLPDVVQQILPPLLAAAGDIVAGLVAALPVIIQVLAEQAPFIITSIVDAILDNLALLIDAALQLMIGLGQGLVEALPQVVDRIPEIIQSVTDAIVNNMPLLVQVGAQLIIGLGEGLIVAIPELLKAIGRVIKEFLKQVLALFGIHSPSRVFSDIGKNLIRGMIDGITSLLSNLANTASTIVSYVKDAIVEKVHDAATWGRDLMDNFIGGITDRLSSLWDTVSGVASGIRDFIGFSEPKKGPLSNFHTYAPDMMALFAQGIKDNTRLITDQISRSFDFGDLGGATFSTFGASTIPTAGGGYTSPNNANNSITGILTEILATLQKMGVYIDGDALVGALSPGMQNQFGMAAMRAR